MACAPSVHVNGSIDGTVNCACGWSKYKVYPGRGWGRKSVGIKRTNMTKNEWLKFNLLRAYITHVTTA